MRNFLPRLLATARAAQHLMPTATVSSMTPKRRLCQQKLTGEAGEQSHLSWIKDSVPTAHIILLL